MTIGIYCIEHTESGKKYIGKSKHIEKRFREHKHHLTKSEHDKCCNIRLYMAVRKYGLSSFRMYILEDILDVDEALLAAREIYWMVFYSTTDCSHGYNLKLESLSGTTFTEDARTNMSNCKKGSKNPMFGVVGENHPRFGSSPSAETLVKMSGENNHRFGLIGSRNPLFGVRGKNHALFGRPKNPDSIGKSVEARSKYSYQQISLTGELIKIFPRLRDVANGGFNTSAVQSVCSGKSKTHSGYIWKTIGKIPLLLDTTPKPCDNITSLNN